MTPVPLIRLTRRQREVLRLVATGASYKEIAVQLGVTSKTARNHLSNLYRQLDVHNRAQAVLCAFELGLVDPIGQRGTAPREAYASSTLAWPNPTIVSVEEAGPPPATGGANGRPS